MSLLHKFAGVAVVSLLAAGCMIDADPYDDPYYDEPEGVYYYDPYDDDLYDDDLYEERDVEYEYELDDDYHDDYDDDDFYEEWDD